MSIGRDLGETLANLGEVITDVGSIMNKQMVASQRLVNLTELMMLKFVPVYISIVLSLLNTFLLGIILLK